MWIMSFLESKTQRQGRRKMSSLFYLSHPQRSLFLVGAMKTPFDFTTYLEIWIQRAAATLDTFDTSFEPQIRPADPKFGDYQANGILAFAKKNKMNPREAGAQLLEAMQADSEYDPSQLELTLSGPGFINITLTPKLLHLWLNTFRNADEFSKGIDSPYRGKKIIVDYPSPNTAKQMHIGHLRPMVIGDAVQRLLKFSGAEVVCDNHIGDWGTNFGTLIMAIKRDQAVLNPNDEDAIEQLEILYKKGTQIEEADTNARAISRNELLKLQQGDSENRDLWEQIVTISNKACQSIYNRLGITIDMTLGESFYQDKIDRVYTELEATKGKNDNKRALFMAFANFLCCCKVTPVARRGKIFPCSVTNNVSKSISL